MKFNFYKYKIFRLPHQMFSLNVCETIILLNSIPTYNNVHIFSMQVKTFWIYILLKLIILHLLSLNYLAHFDELVFVLYIIVHMKLHIILTNSSTSRPIGWVFKAKILTAYSYIGIHEINKWLLIFKL